MNDEDLIYNLRELNTRQTNLILNLQDKEKIYIKKINELENKVSKIKNIIDNLIIIENRDYIGMEKYRPIKNTTKDDCYKALFQIKRIVN